MTEPQQSCAADDRHAWQLRHRDRLPWPAIAEQFVETEAFVKYRVRRYIARYLDPPSHGTPLNCAVAVDYMSTT